MNRPVLPCPRCGRNIINNPSHADTCMGRTRRRVDIYRPQPYHPKPTEIDEIDDIDYVDLIDEVDESREMGEVTIGIGFKCDDGIVLAADTQHSGALKLRGEKVIQIVCPPGIAACVAGAGRVSLIRKAVELIGKSISKSGPSGDILAIVEDALSTIHRKYIYPYSGPEENRPSVQLLVGVWTENDGLRLVDTEQSIPNFVDDYAVIGSGGNIAEYIIKTSRGYIHSAVDAKYLAAYAVAMAKTYDLFCGGETRIKILSSTGKLETTRSDEIKDAETFFEDLVEANRVTICGLNMEAFEDADLDILVDDYKANLIRFREKARKRRQK